MIQISIVIPIYNVGPFLTKCLDSVFEQIDDTVEIIMVNDGSTDNSKEICEQYINKHPNVVVLNKKNGGLSDARNAGTTLATGNYIYYLDSDDWLAPKAIRTLYDFAIDNNCEVVQGGFYYAYEDYLLFDNSRDQPQILDRNAAMLELIRNDYVKNFAWGKLYRADIVKKYQFPFGKYYEDTYWQHFIINETSHYGIIPAPLYYYRQRSASISGSFSLRNLDQIEGNERRLQFIMQELPLYSDEMARELWKTCFSLVNTAKAQKDSKIKQAYQQEWERLNREYHVLFDKALANDILYRWEQKCPALIPVYLLWKRIINKLNSSNNSKFITIHIDTV